jgi:hypothetical protein
LPKVARVTDEDVLGFVIAGFCSNRFEGNLRSDARDVAESDANALGHCAGQK